jgi:hypothetical protein
MEIWLSMVKFLSRIRVYGKVKLRLGSGGGVKG